MSSHEYTERVPFQIEIKADDLPESLVRLPEIHEYVNDPGVVPITEGWTAKTDAVEYGDLYVFELNHISGIKAYFLNEDEMVGQENVIFADDLGVLQILHEQLFGKYANESQILKNEKIRSYL